MNLSMSTFKSMSVSEIDSYFSISSCKTYTCVNTEKEYSPYEIAEMTRLLFCEQLPQAEQEIILLTLAHMEGSPIPMILKTFYELQKTAFKYFAECAYQESCMWNDVECPGVECIEFDEDCEYKTPSN